ncbi:TonB-dependent receptor [Chryseobacterium sp. T1]
MKRIYYFFLFSGIPSFGQEIKIDSVVIDPQLSKASEVSVIKNLTQKDILKNSVSLSDVLRFQTPIYIKENSRGMVSSPSFRGTTSQQTAFVWNGININSQFLAQGDVNNISLFGYDNIDVKSGGGSVIYGSGAIGGSVHLNNELAYDKGFSANIFTEYASYNTLNTFLKTNYSNDKISVQVSANHSQSKNDYEVIKKYYVNRDAKYLNSGVNLGFGYKLTEKLQLYFQSQHFDGEQHYPALSENSDRTKYDTQTFRSLLGLKSNFNNFKNDFKVAYLEDNFQYFGNANTVKSSGGASKQYLIKNDASFNITSASEINLISEISQVKAEGYRSGIDKVSRDQASFSLLYRNRALEKFYWELGVKKDFVENVEAPFLFSAGASYRVFDWYKTTINLSKNFRYPSFNDLYWQPGGNLDLKPEVSYQVELSQNFKVKNFQLILTPYAMRIYDMIRWLPKMANLWSPVNTNDVLSYGLESQVRYTNQWGNHRLSAQVGYSYTRSQNEETQLQLMYVPLHKANFGVDYNYKSFSIFAQGLYIGKVFTNDLESDSFSIKQYASFNVGANYNITKALTIGFKVNNITNQAYENVQNYWMPLRNYSGQILIKL